MLNILLASKKLTKEDLAAKIQTSTKCLLKIGHLSQLFSGWRRLAKLLIGFC